MIDFYSLKLLKFVNSINFLSSNGLNQSSSYILSLDSLRLFPIDYILVLFYLDYIKGNLLLLLLLLFWLKIVFYLIDPIGFEPFILSRVE